MKRPPLSNALAALLLVSPAAWSESPRDTVFEPAPVFEDEDLSASAKRWVPRTDPVAAEKTASPPATAPVAPVAAPPAPPTMSAATEVPNSQRGADPAADGFVKSWITENYPIGLIVLTMAGVVLWSTRTSSEKGLNVDVRRSTADTAGDTGVSRYLKQQGAGEALGGNETGVTRYLKNVTGVAASGERETGVARYLKNHT